MRTRSERRPERQAEQRSEDDPSSQSLPPEHQIALRKKPPEERPIQPLPSEPPPQEAPFRLRKKRDKARMDGVARPSGEIPREVPPRPPPEAQPPFRLMKRAEKERMERERAAAARAEGADPGSEQRQDAPESRSGPKRGASLRKQPPEERSDELSDPQVPCRLRKKRDKAREASIAPAEPHQEGSRR